MKPLCVMTSVAICLGLSIGAGSAVAQDVPAAEVKVQVNAPGIQALRYQVNDVQGRVKVARIGAEPANEKAWRQIVKGELLGPGLQIRTFFRSKLKLVAYPSDPPTVMLIERSTLMSISELRFEKNDKGEKTAKSRLGLGYGAIRCGVDEGRVRSDMEIAMPGATLSKKGTDIFRVWVYGQRWGMSLSSLGRGQIQAIQNLRSGLAGQRSNLFGGLRTRNLFPGQSVTDRMLRTIETTVFDRTVNINDLFGLQDTELWFNSLYGNGLGFLVAGSNFLNIRTATKREVLPDDVSTGMNDVIAMGGSTSGGGLALQQAINNLRNQNQVHANNSGDFGIGGGILPAFFGATAKPRIMTPRLPDLGRAMQKMMRKQSHIDRKRR